MFIVVACWRHGLHNSYFIAIAGTVKFLITKNFLLERIPQASDFAVPCGANIFLFVRRKIGDVLGTWC